MAVDVGNLKEYLRLPPDSTEDLTLYLAAAKSKARAAGVPDYQSNAQYDLFLLALAAMQYDNRGMILSGNNPHLLEQSTANLINSFVLELRHAGEDPDAGKSRPGRRKGGAK